METFKLIEKAKNGCNECFDILIKERGPKLYKIAFGYVKNKDLALEVVSEATFKSYISLKNLNNIEYFDSWLVKIIINESLKVIKAQKKIVSIEDFKENIEDKKDNNTEEKIDLYNALDKLKKDEREIVILKYFGDVTFANIAITMGKSEGTIKTKHYRALDKIKNFMKEIS